jgi:hypothetical protein
VELAALAQLSFFQGMPQWALVRLAEAAAEEVVPAGQMTLRQGDRARAVHFLLAGADPAPDRGGGPAGRGGPSSRGVARLVGLPRSVAVHRLGARRGASPAAQPTGRGVRGAVRARSCLRRPHPPAGGGERHQPPGAGPPAPVPASRSGGAGGGHAVTAAEALPLLADSPFFKGFNRPSTGTVSATPTSSSGPLGDPPTHQGHRSAPRAGPAARPIHNGTRVARRLWSDLIRVGIDKDEVGKQLETEGSTSSPPATRRCSTSSTRKGPS